MHTRFGLTQLIDGFANVITVLTLLNCNHTNCGIGEFVGSGEMRDTVMLVVRELNFVFDPHDCWQWICLDVTFQIHVVLKGLSKTWPWYGNNWSEFNFQIDVAAIAFAHTIVSNTVICSTVLFTNRIYFQYRSSVCRSTWNSMQKYKKKLIWNVFAEFPCLYLLAHVR